MQHTKENDAYPFSDSSRVVFDALIAEAEEAFTKKIKSGKKPSVSMAEVANEMSLNKFEADELVGRIKKKAIPVIEPIIEEPIEEDLEAKPLSLYFENSDQCDSAIKILMDKRIAWSNKGSQKDKAYIQFSDNTSLSEAQSALKRRWDFVENKQRIVADIKFDNLQDYNRILEFMKRQGILIEFDDSTSLDEDYDELLNQHTVSKKLAEKEGREFNEEFSETNSFAAKSKEIDYGVKIDPLRESKYRAATVRKRWK